MQKIYHIYAKDQCIFHSLNEEEFTSTWNTLKNMISLLDTHYVGEDLSYEELTLNKDVCLKSSH
jgi:hypothetical protein